MKKKPKKLKPNSKAKKPTMLHQSGAAVEAQPQAGSTGGEESPPNYPDSMLDIDSPDWCPVACAHVRRHQGRTNEFARRTQDIALQAAIGGFSEIEEG